MSTIGNLPGTNLVEVARQATAQEYAAALKERGAAILDQAVETFFQMDREVEDARRALEGLNELKGSLMAALERDENQTAANLAAAKAQEQKVTAGELPDLRLKGPEVEPLHDAKPRFSLASGVNRYLKDGTTIENGECRWTAESARLETPQVQPMKGLRKFLSDLNAIQGIYASAAMVPGPLSASVKSVAKELMTASSQFASQSISHHSSAGFGLLPLGVYGSEGGSTSFASGNSNMRFEKSTVDERVVPLLMDLRDRLNQASSEPASQGTIQAGRRGCEFVLRDRWLFGPKLEQASYYGSDYSYNSASRVLQSFEFQPARVRMPDSGVSDFQKS